MLKGMMQLQEEDDDPASVERSQVDCSKKVRMVMRLTMMRMMSRTDSVQ